MDSNTENKAAETTVDDTNSDNKYVLKRGRKPVNNQRPVTAETDSKVEINSVCNDAISAKGERKPAKQDANVQKTTEIIDDGLDSQFASKDADDVTLPQSTSRNRQRPARTNDNRRDGRRGENPNPRCGNSDRSYSKPRDFSGKKEQVGSGSTCCCVGGCSLLCKIKKFLAKLFGKKQAPKQEQRHFNNNRPRNNNNRGRNYSSDRSDRPSDRGSRQSDRRNSSNSN